MTLEAFASQLAASTAELPLLFLQAAGIVGMVSVLILVRRDIPFSDERYKLYYGLVFGGAGFLLAVLVSEFIQAPSKPYLRADLLFLAGLLGGWVGGFISFAFIGLARVLIGGAANLGPGMLDIAIVAAAGSLMHGWFRRRSLRTLGVGDVLFVYAVRLAVSLMTVVVFFHLGNIDLHSYQTNMGRRIVGSIVTLPMLACLFFILRREDGVREEERKREQAVRTDPLTGLPNRRALNEYVEALAPSERGRPATVVLVETVNIVDLCSVHGDDWGDRFWPRLADEIGHGEVGAALKAYRPRIFLFGDATLAIVLHGASVPEIEGAGLMEDLHAGMTASFQSTERGLIPQLRIGAASLDTDLRRSVASTLRRASLALRGSDSLVQVFPRSFAERAHADESVRMMLVDWIKHGTPPMMYQPQFELRSRRMVGAEALLRATDAAGKPLSPLYVLEVAERHRMLVELEWATVRAVVRDLTRLDGVDLAVNISAASFATARFGERVVTLLRDMGVEPHRLAVEVTETSKMPTIGIVEQNVETLGQAGIKLSLDDFGTGYAALTLLARFPFAEVKVDHWMIARLEQERIREAVALAFESARRYGAKLVTEGIETEEQRQQLMQMGIEIGQGYLYSAAVPTQRLAELLAAEQR
ncbi:bifunctional diguanylate cyclase/phosphodiesterase [Thauera butanivorans]|uniref:bifunctional diguanylate cyclase/phosphodiesterase n=1 Tax=Thauera butanivorans TaxID=86174 RepID=UPI000837CD9D|nr:GGDEF domain-containing protein [Thauera butanivorans]